MPEFMKIVDVKEHAAKLASNKPEMATLEDIEALSENLKARGIIDDKGLVRHGNSR